MNRIWSFWVEYSPRKREIHIWKQDLQVGMVTLGNSDLMVIVLLRLLHSNIDYRLFNSF